MNSKKVLALLLALVMCLAIVIDGKIAETKRILINPEAPFSPIASRIHGITSEDVVNAPTFPEVWQEVYACLTKYPVVAHNVSFDIGVLFKVADRYNLDVPSFTYYCTMAESIRHLHADNGKLETICAHIGVALEKHHDSAADAQACANIMLCLLEQNATLAAEHYAAKETVENLIARLDSFELELLQTARKIILEGNMPRELVRCNFSNSLSIRCYYRDIKFGIVRGKRYIAVREEYLPLVSCELEHDSTKAFHRFFLSQPQDLYLFEEYMRKIIEKSHSEYSHYRDTVSERTVSRHMKEYKNGTFDFLATL